MPIAEFQKYQDEARKTSFCPAEYKIIYATVGLTGEAGELANKVKKIMRGDANRAALLEEIKSDMGDVLWYLSALADDLDVTLADIAEMNIKKLRDRQQRDRLRGSGDER